MAVMKTSSEEVRDVQNALEGVQEALDKCGFCSHYSDLRASDVEALHDQADALYNAAEAAVGTIESFLNDMEEE